jgi:fucose permease
MSISSRSHLSIVDLHAGFFLAGMATTLLGPLLPFLTRRWGIADAAAGSAFALQFVASTTVSTMSAVVVVRYGARQTLSTGFVLIAMGVATLSIMPWPWGLAAIVVYGCGLGLVLPTTNFLVAAANPGKESAAVSLVNVSWSAGAVTWPLLVTRLGTSTSAKVPLLLLSALMLALVARLWFAGGRGTPLVNPASSAAARSTVPLDEGRAQPAAVSVALVWIFAGLMFLYSGSEAAVGGWIAEYVHRLSADAPWTIAPTIFWGALSAGRLLTPVLLTIATERTLLVSGLGAASIATAALVAIPSVPVALSAAAIAGAGLAPAFPINFAALSRDIAASRPSVVGPVYALTGVGSAMLPWMVGFSSSFAQSLRIAMIVPLAGCVALLALSLIRLRLERA